MRQQPTKNGARLAWTIAAVVVILAIAFEGHRLAQELPRMERWVEHLGPAGPAILVGAIFALEPLLFPNAIFGFSAGVAFGLWRGFLVYFSAVYIANIFVYLIGQYALRAPVLGWLERRPSIRNAVAAVHKEGASLVFWIRLLPINPAIFSYALGALHVPLRAVAIGSLGMFPHMLLEVYAGTVAVHVTKIAGEPSHNWEVEGVGLILGLIAAGMLSWRIAKIARSHIETAQAEDISER